jgi:hypothetical protein
MAKGSGSETSTKATSQDAGSTVHRLWAFVKDPENRAIMTWIGSGLTVVIGGAWVALATLFPVHKPDTPPPLQVKAEQGSVAIGGNVSGSPITVGAGSLPKPPEVR